MSLRQHLALAAGRATARLPPRMNDVLWRVLRLASRHPIRRLTGQTHAGSRGVLLMGGSDPALEYMPGLFFADEPEVALLERVPLLRLGRRLRELRGQADLTCARVDGWAAPYGFDQAFLRVPEWIRSSMPVPGNDAGLRRGNNSLRQDLRLIRKHGYVTEASHADADLEDFYQRMFRTHTLARHGSVSYLRTLAELRPLFRRGALLWIKAENVRVGGVLCSRAGERMVMAANGVLPGAGDWLRKGVLAATYAAAIEHARAEGCTRLDFGGTRPSVSDSLLRYKRKWGAELDRKTANHHLLLTAWNSNLPSIVAMLRRTPLLFRRSSMLCVVTAEDACEPEALTLDGIDETWLARAGAAGGSGGLVRTPGSGSPAAEQQTGRRKRHAFLSLS